MRGSVDYLINRLFVESGVFTPSASRHAAKAEARDELTALGLPAASTAIAARTGLHSYTYARDCKDTWRALGHFAREHCGVRDMFMLTGEHAESYLTQRIHDGVGYATWKKEAAHIGKLDRVFENLGRKDTDFRQSALDAELREYARTTLYNHGQPCGHFQNPASILAAMQRLARTESQADAVLVARMQWEGGARCREACRIEPPQLRGAGRDTFTGHLRGQIQLIDTKGGKPRTIQVSPELYALLEQRTQDQPLYLNRRTYAKFVEQAALQAGETLIKTHAWRYCFARGRHPASIVGDGP